MYGLTPKMQTCVIPSLLQVQLVQDFWKERMKKMWQRPGLGNPLDVPTSPTFCQGINLSACVKQEHFYTLSNSYNLGSFWAIFQNYDFY